MEDDLSELFLACVAEAEDGDKITPDINPLYVGIERSFPDDSKNVSFIDMGLV